MDNASQWVIQACRDIVEKWGRPVAERGFAQVPNYLLLLNSFMDPDRRLSPVEMLLILQLVGTWWKKESMPFPSMATLAARCGVSDRQIQRAVNRLVKIGLLDRIKRRTSTGIRASNAYDLQPLVVLLNQVAKAFPNDYPRNVDRAKIREITKQMDKAPEVVQTEISIDLPLGKVPIQ